MSAVVCSSRRTKRETASLPPVAQAAGQLITVITWPASPGATGYKIYRGTSAGVHTNNWTVGNVLEYDINLLTPKMNFNTTYYYAIAAIDGGGEGAKGTEFQVRNWVKL